jgi:hypothetical protein
VVPIPALPTHELGQPPRMNSFVFEFPTTVGANYTVEATTDFKTWSPLQTFTATAPVSKTPFNSVNEIGFVRLRQN